MGISDQMDYMFPPQSLPMSQLHKSESHSPVFNTIAEVTNTLDELNALVESLQARLVPVLTPEVSQVARERQHSTGANAHDLVSPLTEQLQGNLQQLRAVRNRLLTVLDRVAL